ncbi:MAG: hypothetical protein ABS41_06445 [Arenimonas sp. SCN 70-307]|uniref:hypothetical protein n=1 Tax=Arenimonas sp. SCN 70-307 TaxID=1660089 RepID=UPI00086DCF7C|nr:hypothetical protein [Arenimonas sp. SCN 70-307]ODS62820.1 MAG: hypothetical protein ABS41_06445 [Arenimonas sp. SCN 70-307]
MSWSSTASSPTTTIDCWAGWKYLRPMACTCSAVTSRMRGTNSPMYSGGSPASQFEASVPATEPCSWLEIR